MGRWIGSLLLLAAILLSPDAARTAEPLLFFVAMDGNNAADCRSQATACRTAQGAIDKIPLGSIANVMFAPGNYPDPINILYYRFVALWGDCKDRASVVLRVDIRQAIIWVQDHAVATINCLTLEATAEGATGIAARQFSIADYSAVRFGQFPAGTHVHATEMGKINCINREGEEPGIEIFGDASRHGNATDGSTLSLNCDVSIIGSRKFDYFLTANVQSIIRADGL